MSLIRQSSPFDDEVLFDFLELAMRQTKNTLYMVDIDIPTTDKLTYDASESAVNFSFPAGGSFEWASSSVTFIYQHHTYMTNLAVKLALSVRNPQTLQIISDVLNKSQILASLLPKNLNNMLSTSEYFDGSYITTVNNVQIRSSIRGNHLILQFYYDIEIKEIAEDEYGVWA